MSRDNTLGPIGAPLPPGTDQQFKQQAQVQPHVYEIFIRLPGMVSPQLHSKVTCGSIDKAVCLAASLFYDNGSILEVRVVKTDSKLIVPA